MAQDKEDFEPARICWEGGSKETLAGFPDSVRADLEFSLWQLQLGQLPSSATRRMESVGSGVWELKEQDQRAWYRVLYLSKIDDVIYVLHCFEKQSLKTDQRDLSIARERLKLVRSRIKEKRDAKKAK